MPNKVGQLIEDNPNAMQRNNLKLNQRIKHKPDYDGETRFELFLLDDGQKKVEWKDETRVPNTAVFTFNKEDHTLGNLLSQRLHQYKYITFSAYKVPHPLFATFELRVSTDGTMTPKEAIIQCCQDIVKDLDQLSRSFTTEWLGKRIVSEGEAERVAREQNNF
ncbi:RBP11-like subunits of RNA polymerase [Melanomma pulvis-pyrius CBS 109.77]|uniref:RBP11-like subunits of RNA polymerase n=1 Tax=Melanomma pulvis-pyrius CBS 109.77 TaxID=1314802 RepID=A0A6A6WZ49_9PLEO|nr:RBP11-like subunits of RNA polymerase [Melanomma pulvis-pyrius CBS 109.77]